MESENSNTMSLGGSLWRFGVMLAVSFGIGFGGIRSGVLNAQQSVACEQRSKIKLHLKTSRAKSCFGRSLGYEPKVVHYII